MIVTPRTTCNLSYAHNDAVGEVKERMSDLLQEYHDTTLQRQLLVDQDDILDTSEDEL